MVSAPAPVISFSPHRNRIENNSSESVAFPLFCGFFFPWFSPPSFRPCLLQFLPPSSDAFSPCRSSLLLVPLSVQVQACCHVRPLPVTTELLTIWRPPALSSTLSSCSPRPFFFRSSQPAANSSYIARRPCLFSALQPFSFFFLLDAEVLPCQRLVLFPSCLLFQSGSLSSHFGPRRFPFSLISFLHPPLSCFSENPCWVPPAPPPPSCAPPRYPNIYIFPRRLVPHPPFSSLHRSYTTSI